MKNKTSVMRICLCAALAAMGMTAVVHAKTTAWIGSGGDALWSTAGNWNNGLPAAGDAVIVSNLTASAITVENDLGDIAFASLSLQGSAAVTLRGNAITLTGNVAVGAAGAGAVPAGEAASLFPQAQRPRTITAASSSAAARLKLFCFI